MKRILWIFCFATFLPVIPSWAQHDSVFKDGKEWLQPVDFNYTYDQVNAVCPGGVCSGKLPGSALDLTGYTWASIYDVSNLFNAYGVNPPFTEPFQERHDDNHAAAAIVQDFVATALICFGDCPVSWGVVAGMVRNPAPAGEMPYAADFFYGDFSPDNPSFNNTAFTGNISPGNFDLHDETPGIVGAWFYRQVDDPPQIPKEDFIVSLEEPIRLETHSGIGNLRGWAIAEDGIDRVEIYIDGKYMYDAPFGGERIDVGDQYPDIADSDNSGFSLAFGYSNLSIGEHTITARAFDMLGEFQESTSIFEVIAFHKDFINRWDIVGVSEATMAASGNEILLHNVSVDGQPYQLRLKWRTAEQGFEIIDITGEFSDTVAVESREWLQVDLFRNLSWNDINAVCPEGICAGVLNGYSVTGWTWATVEDLNALFNHYVGRDVLGPGPAHYMEGPDSEWAPAFFNDGWRDMDSGPTANVTGWVRSLAREFDAYTPSLADDDTPLDDTFDVVATDPTTGVELSGDSIGGWFYRIP